MKKYIIFLILICLISVGATVFYKRANISLLQSSTKPTLIGILGLVDSLDSMVTPISEDSDKIVVSVGKLKVIFSKNKSLESQVSALTALIKELRINEKNYEVDLRFNKAIIREF